MRLRVRVEVVSTQYLWVPGPLPGANEALAACRQARGKGSAYSNMKRAYTLMVMGLAKKAKLSPVKAANFRFTWHDPKTGRKGRDPDGVHFGAKFVLDGLATAGVLVNDGPKQVLRVVHEPIRYVPAELCGVEVEIEEVDR